MYRIFMNDCDMDKQSDSDRIKKEATQKKVASLQNFLVTIT